MSKAIYYFEDGTQETLGGTFQGLEQFCAIKRKIQERRNKKIVGHSWILAPRRRKSIQEVESEMFEVKPINIL